MCWNGIRAVTFRGVQYIENLHSDSNKYLMNWLERRVCEEEEGKGVRYVNQRKKCVREKHGGGDAKGTCLTPSLFLSNTPPSHTDTLPHQCDCTKERKGTRVREKTVHEQGI